MNMSNIIKLMMPETSPLGCIIREFEESKDADFPTLLKNIKNTHNDNMIDDIHQNAYREMLVIIMERKWMGYKKFKATGFKKAVKFEIMLKNDNQEMIIDDNQNESAPAEDSQPVDFDCSEALYHISKIIWSYKDIAMNIVNNIIGYVIKESRWYDEISPEEEKTLLDLIINYISVEEDQNFIREGVRTLFDYSNTDEKNKNKRECMMIMNTLLQILNPDHMAKQYSNMNNKHKNNFGFDGSKLKSLKRRILAAHYWPFTYILTDSKAKSEYLANTNINTDIFKQLLILCSLQRLIYAYATLNIALLHVCNKELSSFDDKVIANQFKLYVKILEEPATKFLNHPNWNNKCQSVVNSYLLAFNNKMSAINVLKETYSTRRIGRIVENIISKLSGMYQNSYESDGDEVMAGPDTLCFRDFCDHVIKTLIEPFLK